MNRYAEWMVNGLFIHRKTGIRECDPFPSTDSIFGYPWWKPYPGMTSDEIHGTFRILSMMALQTQKSCRSFVSTTLRMSH